MAFNRGFPLRIVKEKKGWTLQQKKSFLGFTYWDYFSTYAGSTEPYYYGDDILGFDKSMEIIFKQMKWKLMEDYRDRGLDIREIL